MKIRTLIKILLILTGGLYVLSVAIQDASIELYVKPMTVPLFFMLYWFNVKKVDVLFLAILLLCFLGDVFLLTDIKNNFIYVLVSYALCYSILFYYLLKSYRSVNFSVSNIVYLVVFFVVWTYVVYEIYSAIEGRMGDIKLYGLIYMIVLYFLLIGAVLQYTNVRSTKSLWFLIAILNFVISDSCFALHKFYISSVELEVINATYQLLAVFFLVKYKISSPVSLKLKSLQL